MRLCTYASHTRTYDVMRLLILRITQNPDYMKDGFHITIETIHVPNDIGQQENVSHLAVATCSVYILLLLHVYPYDIEIVPNL